MNQINSKVHKATKWTLITEFMSKLISPITGMILARLLTPEAFGIMASILIITSFAEMFADAGFQKYFVQHEFYDEAEKQKCFITALVTSCIVASFIWILIVCFAGEIAVMLGTPEVAAGIKVAGLGIVLTSYNGMQVAMFKRSFQFKFLFKLRIVTLIIPLLVTIPLAFLGFGYWALVWGMLAQQAGTCLVQARYVNLSFEGNLDFRSLQRMLSFSLWSLFESFTIWFSTYGGMFLIGILLSNYYLGLYRGIISLSGAIFGIITGAITPVFFAGMSRLQNDMEDFRHLFYDIQRKAVLILMPLGAVVFVFADVVVEILLGNQWHEGDFFFGVWGMTSVFSIAINSLASEALRAKGMPRLSAFSQLLHFPVLWGGLWYGAKFGFDAVALGICASSLWLDFVKLVMLRQALGFSISKMIANISNGALSAVVAGALAWWLRKILIFNEWLAVLISIFAFVLCYLVLIAMKKDNRVIFLYACTFFARRHENKD